MRSEVYDIDGIRIFTLGMSSSFMRAWAEGRVCAVSFSAETPAPLVNCSEHLVAMNGEQKIRVGVGFHLIISNYEPNTALFSPNYAKIRP